MSAAPMGEDRDRLESGLAARRLVTRLGSTDDQVPRKLAYERAHPDVVFHPPRRSDPMWTAVLNDGDFEVRALDLDLLLAKLDRMG